MFMDDYPGMSYLRGIIETVKKRSSPREPRSFLQPHCQVCVGLLASPGSGTPALRALDRRASRTQ